MQGDVWVVADGCFSGLTRSPSRSAGGQYTLPTATGTAYTHNLQHRGNETNQQRNPPPTTKTSSLYKDLFLTCYQHQLLFLALLWCTTDPNPRHYHFQQQRSSRVSHQTLVCRTIDLSWPRAQPAGNARITLHVAHLSFTRSSLVWMARCVCGYVESIVSKYCVCT